MYQFTLQLVFIGSLSVMVYLMIRSLPRVSTDEQAPTIYDYLDRWSDRLPLQHLDDRLNTFLFKTLKRLRVVTMKIDNSLLRHMNRVKRHQDTVVNGVSPVHELLEHVNGDITKEN